MADNNSYWQFQQTMIETSSPMVLQQQLSPQQPFLHHQQHWSEDSDKRKWNQSFVDFDVRSQNGMFCMDEYSNNEPSEGDSPDSIGNGGGGSQKRNDLLSDVSLFQGGDQKQRRKEQNRAAQRAFRERKEKYVKELQVKIKEMEKKHQDELDTVNKENTSLKQLVKKMKAEIYTLKGAAMAFDVSIHKLREAGLDVQHRSRMREHSSSPQNDRPSPTRMEEFSSNNSSNGSAMSAIRDISTFDRYSRQDTINYSSHDNQRSNDMEDSNMKDEFAERETNRFDHHVDPIIRSGAKVIPCSQIWERLSEHPNFDDFDMDRLCEELKRKAICSGTGPVILESELLEVLNRMDVGNA